MIATGIVFLSMGIPCIMLGFYYRKNPPPPPKGKKAPKAQKGKKGKKAGKSQKADRPNEEKAKKGGGMSLILGGLAFSAIGIGFLVAHFMK